ncbi:MAG: DUF748 domain-containing protein, partial [Candidatus Omnitrophota bacterium]|nr:DUF748 domain-containing protein [Candidatus Omnitrophota bacterium]
TIQKNAFCYSPIKSGNNRNRHLRVDFFDKIPAFIYNKYMKKVRKIILRTVLVTILIICAASWYLNNIFLPQQVKLWIVNFLGKETSRQVSLEKVGYNIFKGIVLKGLTVFEDSAELNEKFLTVEEIYFKLPLPPLFGRKLIITNLYIQSPELAVTRRKSKDWNFSSILTTKPGDKRGKFAALISRAVISEGKISFTDLTKDPQFDTQIEAINGKIYLTLPANINFEFNLTAAQTPAITVQSSGTYNFLLKTLNLKLNTKDILLTDYAAYYRETVPFEVLEGKADLELVFSSDKDKNIHLQGTSSIKQLNVQQELSTLPLAKKTLKDKLKGTGNLTITTNLAYNLDKKSDIEYSGDITFSNFTFRGLPAIETLENINGKIEFFENILSTAALNLVVFGAPISLKGKLSNFNNPLIEASLTSDIDLSKTRDSLPAQLKNKFNQITVAGKALLSMGLEGGIRHIQYSGQAEFSNASVKNTLLAEGLKDINGILQFNNNGLSVPEVTFFYNDTAFKLNGSLASFNKPNIDFNLSSKDLDLHGGLILKDKLNPKDENIYIAKVEGKYFDSSFNLTGNIAGFKKPLLNLQGDVDFNLNDLTKIAAPEYSQELSDLNPKGRLSLSGKAGGKWNEWKDWSGIIEAKSKRISIKEITLERLLLDVKVEDEKIFLVKLAASPYGGILTSTGFMELGQPHPYYKMEIDLLNLDLGEIGKEPVLNWPYSSGYLTGKLNLEGYKKKPETIIGKGWIKIGEGKFWEIPLFKDLANTLYFPNLQKVLFKRGFTTFIVADKAVRTSDLLLEGEGLNLSAKGLVGFDGNLNFSITTELARGLTQQSPELGKIANMIMSGLWNYIIEIRLKGTIKEPEYSIMPKLPIKSLIER